MPLFLRCCGLLLVLQLWLLSSSVALASSAHSIIASPSPSAPTDPAFALARVSVVRLVIAYTDPNDPTKTIANCTGLGILIKSVPVSTVPTQAGLPNDWVLTDSSLVDQAKARCLDTQPLGKPSQVQILFNTTYNSQTPVIDKVNGPAIICSDNACSTGPAFIGFQGELAPFVDLASSSPANGDHVAIPLTNVTGTVPAEGDTPGNDSAFLLPQLLPNPTAQTPLEVGTPLIDADGHLTHLASTSASLIGVDAINALIAANTGSTIFSALIAQVNNLVNTNWRAGVAAFYQGSYAAAQTSFHNATTYNPKFQAASDFENVAKSKLPSNPSSTGTSASQSNGGGTGFLGINLPLQLWQLDIILLVLLAVVVLLGARIIGARLRRRRALDDEFNDANRRAAAVAQEIEAMEASQRAWAQHNASSEHPAVQMQQGLQDKTIVRKNAVDLRCPRCGESVAHDANYCPNCRLLLSPTESGMHLRVRPSTSSAQPPVAQVPFNSQARTIPPALPSSMVPVGSVADQPTLAPPPLPASDPGGAVEHSPVLGSDITWKRPDGVQDDTTIPYSIPQLPPKRLGFMVGTRSDPGLKRKYKPNEDSLLAAQGVVNSPLGPQPFGLFVIADGMGGHANGQDASRLAIQMIVENILPRLMHNGSPFMDYAQILLDGIQSANQAVHQQNMEKRGDMGTTVTSALVVGPTAYVANVGDSRTYLYRNPGGLQKVTNDHSVVASLVEAGIIKPDDIYTHPKRNQIYRSLGEKAIVEIDAFNVQLLEGDKLLLCSDGLWDMVRDPLIEAVIGRPAPDPSKTGDDLIQSALEGGGEDNVSVIVVQVIEGKNLETLPRVELLAKPDTVQMPQL